LAFAIQTETAGLPFSPSTQSSKSFKQAPVYGGGAAVGVAVGEVERVAELWQAFAFAMQTETLGLSPRFETQLS
jgi:hypothetical protein